MHTFFKPGIALLNTLRYPHKFLLIGFIFLLPLLVMGYSLINELKQEIRNMELERSGLEYVAQLRHVLDGIQQHRGMSAAWLGGANEFRSRLMQRQVTNDNYFTALRAVDKRLGEQLGSSELLHTLERDWQQLKQEVANYTLPQSFERHTSLIKQINSLMTHIATSSHLTLDADRSSNLLSELLTDRIPALSEDMGQSRAAATAFSVKGSLDLADRALLATRLGRVETQENAVKHRLGLLHTNTVLDKQALAGGEVAIQAVESFNKLIMEILTNNQLNHTADDIYTQTTQAIDTIFALYDSLLPQLDKRLAMRMNQDKQTITQITIVMLAVLLLIIYLFVAFYLAVLHAIDHIKTGIQQMASGDLRVQLKLATRDELSHISDQVNALGNAFRELVGSVLHSTVQVTSAAEELSTVSEQTNRVINEQLDQSAQVATAMNEMSATVQEVARSAAATAEATHSTQEEVNTGNQVVHETVQTINTLATEIQETAVLVHKLGEDSNEIGQVVDVIKGIAEQTNLLALNAAIEAARAGEQGRGFAVVADEVRSLASRTQLSTQEIQSMIERLQSGTKKAVQAMNASESRTNEGVTMAARAGSALESIQHSVSTITDMSTQIASAAEEQTTVAEDINRNINEIAKVADQNAAASTQTAAASDELARMAEELSGKVAVFQV
ncbi:MAG: methyl-accepting chemotaxis protein [Thiohalomonadaceae bacterium]